MTTPSIRNLGFAIAIAACLGLASCKDEKTPTTNTPTLPTNAAPPAGESAAAKFDKPLRPDGDVRIELITNGTSPFWDALDKGLDAEKGVLKVTATREAPTCTDTAAQKQTFEAAIAKENNGIGVSVIDADAFAPVIDSAIDKGIPVITFDSDAPKSKRLVYIGTNNFEAGKRAGEAAVKLFPSGGKIVAFVGNLSAANARERYNGFMEAVKGHNIEALQDPYEDNKDSGRARLNVAESITKYGDKINGFLGLYSYNGPAIVDEVEKQHMRNKVKIICFDAEEKTIANLGKGLVDVTVVQKPYEFGRLSLQLLYLINRKGLSAALDEMKPELEKNGMTLDKDKRIIDTGVEVVTPQNKDPFLKKVHDLGLKST
jgi:ribose transport system substrate-binding protein